MGVIERWQDLKPAVVSLKTPRETADWLIKNYLSRYIPEYVIIDGKRKKLTACNILFTDVVQQLRLPGPYHWIDKKGNPLRYSKDAHVKGSELSANTMIDWLRVHGQDYGWERVSRERALFYAANNRLVGVAYYAVPLPEQPPKSGHIAILLEDGTIAQAGAGFPFVGKSVETGFGNLPIEYWVQMQELKQEQGA